MIKMVDKRTTRGQLLLPTALERKTTKQKKNEIMEERKKIHKEFTAFVAIHKQYVAGLEMNETHMKYRLLK